MTEETKFDKIEVYKKWFRTKDKQGFCSITAWFDAVKVVIDVGEVVGEVNATKCFVDAYEFLTWAKAVRDGRAEVLYPERDQCPTPESFVSFGGSGEVARVFKAHWWNQGSNNGPKDASRGFAFKCGHFKGRTTGQGAIIPDFQSPVSVNMIKMTHVEIAEIANRLEHALLLWSMKQSDPLKMFDES